MIVLYLFSVLTLTITPDSLTVGDTIVANLQGKLPDSVSVIMPDSFPDILILDSLTKLNDTIATVKFTSFSTGSQDFKLKINKDTLKATYLVSSVLEPENKGLSPIWGPFGFFNWHYLLYLLIIPMALIFYLLFKRLRKNRTVFIETEQIEPAEEALKNLKILEEKAHSWDWNKIYTTLSYISRRYIERKAKIPAVEATTSELLPLIKKEGLDLFFPLTRQFPEWDLIKFADEESTSEEFNKDVALVRMVIDQMEKEEEKDDSLQ
ncbi:hypothetical protein JW879_07935 [candidate division WOR-3 bacterium]|nr:hypothetical protein [candidate division WOR-3 bacterium]